MSVQPTTPALEDSVSTLRVPSPVWLVALAILRQGMEERAKVYSVARCGEQGSFLFMVHWPEACSHNLIVTIGQGWSGLMGVVL